MNYVERLQEAIRKSHGCESVHHGTVPVTEWFEGKIVWQGEVEVFDLIGHPDGHPDASRCYSWAYEDDDGREQCTAVLGVAPVDSPKAAVRAALIAKVKSDSKKT